MVDEEQTQVDGRVAGPRQLWREPGWWERKKLPWELYPPASNPRITMLGKVEWRWWIDTCVEVGNPDDECPGFITEHSGPGGEWTQKRECPLHGFRWVRSLMTAAEQKEDLAIRRHAAQIPPRYEHYTLYNFPRRDGKAARTCADYAAQGKLTGNLMLFGEFGTGKTSLAVSILQERIEVRGERGLFQNVALLFEDIKASFGQMEPSTLFQRVMNVPLLVLDDLGAERVTEWVGSQLYTMLNYRLTHEKPTVVTTNLDILALTGQLGQRTVERLKEGYKVVHVGGTNLRDGG